MYGPRVENINLQTWFFYSLWGLFSDEYFIFPMFIWFNIPQFYSEDHKYYRKVNSGIQKNVKLPAVGFMWHITWFVLLFQYSHMAQFFQSENIYFLKDWLPELQLERKVCGNTVCTVWNLLFYGLCPSCLVKNKTMFWGKINPHP